MCMVLVHSATGYSMPLVVISENTLTMASVDWFIKRSRLLIIAGAAGLLTPSGTLTL
jgi:hypothetical protein